MVTAVMKNKRLITGRAIWELFVVLLMIAFMSTFWSLVVVGVIRLFFELSERVAVLYVGGGVFLGLFLLGVWNYKKIVIYVK